jgi:hypothetical protein
MLEGVSGRLLGLDERRALCLDGRCVYTSELRNKPKKALSFEVARGHKQQPLSESFFNALTSASDFGGQFANRAIVACP